MQLKEKYIKIAKTLNTTKDDFIWILYYEFFIWDFTILDKFSKIIYFDTKEEVLEFKEKLSEIEISLFSINFLKKEIYIPFEF